MVHMEEYQYDELGEIVKGNSEDLEFDEETLRDIASVCRGNARNATLMAKDNILQFARRHNVSFIDMNIWGRIKSVLGILPLGLENTELQILKVLKERNICSLTNISAVTGLSTQALRAEFELYPLKHNLMEIAQGGRRLTKQGREYLEAIGE